MRLDEIERRADDVLEEFDFSGELPIDPVQIAKHEGIEVRGATFSDPETAGILHVADSPVIFVRSSDNANRQRFTIAHELAHYFLHVEEGRAGDDCEFVDTDLTVAFLRRSESNGEEVDRTRRRREIQANLFAAALLMPAWLLQEELETDDDISRLARLFGVSKAALGIRLAALEELG